MLLLDFFLREPLIVGSSFLFCSIIADIFFRKKTLRRLNSKMEIPENYGRTDLKVSIQHIIAALISIGLSILFRSPIYQLSAIGEFFLGVLFCLLFDHFLFQLSGFLIPFESEGFVQMSELFLINIKKGTQTRLFWIFLLVFLVTLRWFFLGGVCVFFVSLYGIRITITKMLSEMEEHSHDDHLTSKSPSEDLQWILLLKSNPRLPVVFVSN